MKKLLLLSACFIFSLSSYAATELPDFSSIQKKMDTLGLLPASKWKLTKNMHTAINDGNRFLANDRAISATFTLKGKDDVLEKNYMNASASCLKIARSTMGDITSKQADDILLTISAAAAASEKQVSIFLNDYWFFALLKPSQGNIAFTCGVRQNDF
ncbi:hypothetical protein Q4S27_10130 [Morganella morganii subsp. sibonii]